jgi:hypothetical protein
MMRKLDPAQGSLEFAPCQVYTHIGSAVFQQRGKHAFPFYCYDGVRLCPCGTTAPVGPIIRPRGAI